MSLEKNSLVQLRGMAQAFGLVDIFTLDKRQLIQAIQLKQQGMQPEPKIVIPKPEYDARLMDKPPARRSDETMIRELLAPFIARGLRLTFDHERWYMAWDKRTDEGTIRMPLKHVLKCAERVMK